MMIRSYWWDEFYKLSREHHGDLEETISNSPDSLVKDDMIGMTHTILTGDSDD